MKILLVSRVFSPYGGGEVILYNTYKILKKQGHDVYVWATDKRPYFIEDYHYAQYFTPNNNGTLNYIKNPVRFYYNQKAKKDLNKFINIIKPDLIHIHDSNGFSPSFLECCKDIPTVMTVHDSKIICPAATLMYKKNRICNKPYCHNGNFLPCITNNCGTNIEASCRHTLYSYIFNKLKKHIDIYITPSNALKDIILRANIGIQKEQIITVNNFIPQENIAQNPNYKNKGYFLYVGRLSKEKGVHYLLEAMRDLPKDIKLKIVGTGKEEKNLKQYAKENNLNNVEFVGFKNREEIKEYYQNCIATILPCNWFENFPTTNMESFINGKPVIASNIGGIAEQVEHSVTGMLFEPTNIKELKNCILTYWNNPNLVLEQGKNAYQKAKKLYQEDRYYSELITIYHKLL